MDKYNELYNVITGFGNRTARIYQSRDKKDTIIYTDVSISFYQLTQIEEIGFNVSVIFAKESTVEVWIN